MNYNKRQLNIELLRVIAMLMVLIGHANFLIERPDAACGTFTDCARVFLQAVVMMAVNVFVLISGWFGIRGTFGRLLGFMWQVFFFVALIVVYQLIVNPESFEIADIFRCFGLFEGGGWFVASYIALCILSPLLNSFIVNASDKALISVTIAFFVFQTFWGISQSVQFIVKGYSAFSFIGLYLLAQTVRRINPKTKAAAWWLLLWTCIVANTLLWIATSRLGLVHVNNNIFAYINPLMILQALSFLMIFKDLRINPKYSKLILALSSSSFAAYLIHMGTPYAFSVYSGEVKEIYSEYSGIVCLMLSFCVVIITYAMSVVLDMPRKFIWNTFFRPALDRNKALSETVI